MTAPDTIRPLLDAGATLATLAEPGRNLDALAGDIAEIATSLQFVATGLRHAEECAEARYDAIVDDRDLKLDIALVGLSVTQRYDRAEKVRDAERRAALATASRTVQRQIVELARLIGEMEAAIPPAASQSTIFRDHNCWKCKNGTQPCASGHPHRCEYPHAKND